MSSARSRWAIEPGSCMPVSTSTIPSPARDRPRVAVRHAGPRQRQAQAPDAGQHALAAAHLALAGGCGHRRRTLCIAWRRRARRGRDDDGHRRRPDGRDDARRARVLRGARRARPRRASVAAGAPTARRDVHGVRRTASRRDGVRAFFAELFAAVPRLRASRSLETVAEGDRVRGALARDRHVRRAGQLPGLRAQRRARRPRGLDLVAVARRADRRATTPTSTAPSSRASSACCRRRARPPSSGWPRRFNLRTRVSAAPGRRRRSRSPTASGSCAAASRARR